MWHWSPSIDNYISHEFALCRSVFFPASCWMLAWDHCFLFTFRGMNLSLSVLPFECPRVSVGLQKNTRGQCYNRGITKSLRRPCARAVPAKGAPQPAPGRFNTPGHQLARPCWTSSHSLRSGRGAGSAVDWNPKPEMNSNAPVRRVFWPPNSNRQKHIWKLKCRPPVHLRWNRMSL